MTNKSHLQLWVLFILVVEHRWRKSRLKPLISVKYEGDRRQKHDDNGRKDPDHQTDQLPGFGFLAFVRD